VVGGWAVDQAEAQLVVWLLVGRHAKSGQITVLKAPLREGIKPFQRRHWVEFGKPFCGLARWIGQGPKQAANDIISWVAPG
jgi:hypothetical protein